MKKLINIVLGVMLVGMSGCQDFLDRAPLDQASETTFWITADDAQKGLNAVYYDVLPDSRDFWRDCSSDNSVMTNAWGEGGMGYISMGSHSPTDGYISEEWAYGKIRTALYFLDKLSRMNFDQNLKKRFEAEARFMLAMRYFRMAQLFGDLPLIKEKPVTLDESALPRDSKQQVLDYVMENADFAVTNLPDKYTGADVGRVTKGAALMLRANVNLYMASYKKFHAGQNDAALWKKAASDAEEVIKLGYRLENDYASLFRHESNNANSEVILAYQYVQDKITHFLPVLASPSGTGITGGGWASFCPTRDLVDSYECTDGKVIQQSKLYDVKDPWKNRDKRLTQTFMLPGVPVLRPSNTYTPYQPHPSYNMPERMNNEGGGLTGFMYLKFNEPTFPKVDESFTNWPIYRYSETLLILAEALNESEPGNQRIAWAVNQVRARAGLPGIEGMLADQVQTRQLIREERRHEFVAEHKRYFDILRWKIAEHVLSKPAYGINSNVNDPVGDWTKPMFKAQDRVFDPAKHYLWPVPQQSINRNAKLLPQNPNW